MSKKYDSNFLNYIIADFQKGNEDNAFIKLEKYIKEYPNDLIGQYNFAYIAQQMGKEDIAIKNYKIVIHPERKILLGFIPQNNI